MKALLEYGEQELERFGFTSTVKLQIKNNCVVVSGPGEPGVHVVTPGEMLTTITTFSSLHIGKYATRKPQHLLYGTLHEAGIRPHVWPGPWVYPGKYAFEAFDDKGVLRWKERDFESDRFEDVMLDFMSNVVIWLREDFDLSFEALETNWIQFDKNNMLTLIPKEQPMAYRKN